MATTPTQPTIDDWYNDYMKASGSSPSYGVIASAAPTNNVQQLDPKDYQVETTNAGVTNWNVDKNQTVQGLIGGIISQDSPLMQQAATSAKQAAAGRGLGNSSIAIGAGQDAVYHAAMPIATTDAQTYASAAKFNADAANAASMFNAAAKNNASSQNALNALNAAMANQSISAKQYEQAYDAWVKGNLQRASAGDQYVMQQSDQKSRMDLQNAQFASSMSLQQADAASKQLLQQLDADTRTKMAETEAKWRQSMQTSASMAQTYQGFIDNVTQIMASPDLDGPAKQAAIDNLRVLFDNNMKSQEAISGLELGSLVGDMGGSTGGTTKPGETKPGAQPVPPKTAAPPTYQTAPQQTYPNYLDMNQYGVPNSTGA